MDLLSIPQLSSSHLQALQKASMVSEVLPKLSKVSRVVLGQTPSLRDLNTQNSAPLLSDEALICLILRRFHHCYPIEGRFSGRFERLTHVGCEHLTSVSVVQDHRHNRLGSISPQVYQSISTEMSCVLSLDPSSYRSYQTNGRI